MTINSNGFRWIATSAPLASRYDDIFFRTDQLGWAVNSNGEILKTIDGGKCWTKQHHEEAYFRCISMASDTHGWAGTTSEDKQLFKTEDGGESWQEVKIFTRVPDTLYVEPPSAICGLHALSEDVVFASGTNYPERPARFLRTLDGGRTWYIRDMEDVATILVDIYFEDECTGWVVGGRATQPNPRRSDVVPTVLKTENGGETWEDKLGDDVNAPLGEWGWKIQFVNKDFGVVACENLKAGAILITRDGGRNWVRKEIRDDENNMINKNLEGIGFLDECTGWVGGWGDIEFASGRTSKTTDGGKTWVDLTSSWPRHLDEDNPEYRKNEGELCSPCEKGGQYINRFRFIFDGNKKLLAGYASGNTVYKYTNEEIYEPDKAEISSSRLFSSIDSLFYTDHVDIPIVVPSQTSSLSVVLYDRFTGKVRTLVEENNPIAGQRLLSWDLKDDNGEKLTPSQFIVRVNCDDVSESRLIFHASTAKKASVTTGTPHLLRED